MTLTIFWFLFFRHHLSNSNEWFRYLTYKKKEIYLNSLLIWFSSLILFVGYHGFAFFFFACSLHFISLFLLESLGAYLIEKEKEQTRLTYEEQKQDRKEFREKFSEVEIIHPFTVRECLLLLELNPSETNFQVIKKQYRKLAKKYHPDMSGGNVERFKEIKYAYSKLEEILLP